MFERQKLHLILLAVLLALVWLLRTDAMAVGSLRGLSSTAWFWISIGVAILHQVYVWFVWRAELHYSLITGLLGQTWGFRVYALDFTLFLVARPFSIAALASANAGTLPIAPLLGRLLAALLLIPFLYLLYSVFRYFGVRRAMGIDHFDPRYRQAGLVREGIHQYMDNAMYILGPLVLYAIALVFRSQAALLAAAFQHAYVWVHYYCTELPDLRIMYGEDVLE